LDSCSLNSYHLAPAALGPQVFGSWVFGLRVFGLRALETQSLDPRSLGQLVGVRPRRQDTCMHASSIPASWASAAWTLASSSPTSWLLPPSGRRCLGRGFWGRGNLSRGRSRRDSWGCASSGVLRCVAARQRWDRVTGLTGILS
jgi:hypothetical protein